MMDENAAGNGSVLVRGPGEGPGTWVLGSLFGFSNLSLGLAAASRILPLILTKTDLDENRAGYHTKIKGEVTFENVTFTYPRGTAAARSRRR